MKISSRKEWLKPKKGKDRNKNRVRQINEDKDFFSTIKVSYYIGSFLHIYFRCFIIV